MKIFEDKWGIILGGSSGLGLATAKKFAQHGMNLIILHRDRRSDIDEIETEFDKLREKGIQVLSFNVDAVNKTKIKSVIGSFKTDINGNKIKVLIHSIAKGNLKPISYQNEGLRADDLQLTIDSMGISLYKWVINLLENSMFEDDARIISFTSEGSYKAHPGYAAVSAAKASLESISRSLALELAKFNIKVNCIQAGTTETRSFKMIPDNESLANFSKLRNPYNRLTNPSEVANAAFLLTMDEASWINGVVLKVDGGEHLR